MALLKCPECGHDVSSEASSCPHCGYPIKKVEPKEGKRQNIVINGTDGFPFEAEYVKKYKEAVTKEKIIITIITLVIFAIFIPIIIHMFTSALSPFIFFIILLPAIIFSIWLASMFSLKCYYCMAEGQAVILCNRIFKTILIVDGVEVDKVGMVFFSHYFYAKLKSGHTLKVRMNDFKGITFFIDE